MAEYTKHLYLSMLPEALVASQLSPEEFGAYYAVGSEKRARGQAIFFEIDPDYRTEALPVEEGLRRCVLTMMARPNAQCIYRYTGRLNVSHWMLFSSSIW